MICKNCGSESKDNQIVCLRCGFLLKTEKKETIKNKNKFSLFFHRHFFIIIFVFIILFFSGYKICQNHLKIKRITPVNELKIEKTDINYVNDLYKSDERNYHYLLKGYQKEIYRDLLTAMKNFDEKISVDPNKIESTYITEYIAKVYDSLANDHPELINVSTISYSIDKNNLKEIKIIYAMKDNNAYQKYLKQVTDIINNVKEETKNMNDYEKVKYVYKFLATKNNYGNPSDLLNQSAITAFLEDESPVCYGYAKASQILLQNIGINSILLTGELNGGAHAWNFVLLDNQYYYFDVTMSGGTLNYSGFLTKGDRKYTISYPSMVPWILGRKYK